MADQFTRNPVVTAFARGDQSRHQVHADRRQRRAKHRLREHVEFDGD